MGYSNQQKPTRTEPLLQQIFQELSVKHATRHGVGPPARSQKTEKTERNHVGTIGMTTGWLQH